jgi:cytochrome c peroxidase
MLINRFLLLLVLLLLCACVDETFSPENIRTIHSLSIATLPKLTPDPSNRFSENADAAAFGKTLFLDVRLSGTGQVACAGCHMPDRQFQDNRPVAVAIGNGRRSTMPLSGVAWGSWFYWDGRKDSQWSQALSPLESALEHGGDRTSYARFIATTYGETYAKIFGPLPKLEAMPHQASPLGTQTQRDAWNKMVEPDKATINSIFANIGKALAAYERTIVPSETRFDRFADALATGKSTETKELFTEAETQGLRLFIGKAECVLCHNGPRFTDDHFHNIGVPEFNQAKPDGGRADVLDQIRSDPFNCLGALSDAKPDDCGELRFLTKDGTELKGAFKTPSLRGVATRAPYMHSGQFTSLAEVVSHYNEAGNGAVGHAENKRLNLSEKEKASLIEFLKTLN